VVLRNGQLYESAGRGCGLLRILFTCDAGRAGKGGIRQHFIFLAFTLRPGFHTQFLSHSDAYGIRRLFALRAIGDINHRVVKSQ